MKFVFTIVFILLIVGGYFIFADSSNKASEIGSQNVKNKHSNYSSDDFTKNANELQEGSSIFLVKAVLENDMRTVHKGSSSEMTDLEWETFIESEKGETFKKAFKRTLKKLTTTPQFIVLKEGFREFKIRDYDLNKKTFTLDLEIKSSKAGYKPDENHTKMIWEFIFTSMPIYFYKPFASIDIEVSKENALVIEKNREEIDCEIYFYLSDKLKVIEHVKFPMAKAAMLRLSLGEKVLFEKIFNK